MFEKQLWKSDVLSKNAGYRPGFHISGTLVENGLITNFFKFMDAKFSANQSPANRTFLKILDLKGWSIINLPALHHRQYLSTLIPQWIFHRSKETGKHLKLYLDHFAFLRNRLQILLLIISEVKRNNYSLQLFSDDYWENNQSLDLQSKSIDWFLYEGNTGT